MNSAASHYDEVRGYLRESWSMGWPMILIMFFQFSIGITDVYVAGFFATDVLAAVGYVGQLYWTLLIMGNGVTVGTVAMISQAYGARSLTGVASITANSLVIGLVIAGVLTLLSQLFPEQIIRLVGMPEGIVVIAGSFLRVFSLVLTPTYVMIITAGILRASGRIRLAMVNSCTAAVLNVVADVVFSFGWGPFPGMGFIGIAWATATATTVGMTLNLLCIFMGAEGIPFRAIFYPRFKCIVNLLRLGLPSALQQTAWVAGTLVIYFLVGQMQHGQITALAAMTGGVRVEALIFLPVFALNMASAVLTGNKLGSGDVWGARSGAKATAIMCFFIILGPALTVFAFAPVISGLLTQNTAVIDEMTRYLRINMIGMPFMAIGITLSGALQGAGDTFATMRIIFTGMWLFRIPLILFVIHVLKAEAYGVWCAMTFSMIIMCGLLIHRFRGNAWVQAAFDKKRNTFLWHACLPESSSAQDNPTPDYPNP
jgi:multidrug resistance protein, MATE family